MKQTHSLTSEQQQMVEDNLRLVSFVIKKYVHQVPNSVLFQWEDLFQTGCVGLIKAAQAFDSNCGIAFSSFATRCILNQILMSFRKQRVPNISFDGHIENENGEQCCMENVLPDPSQDVYSLLNAKAIVNFLKDKSQSSYKDAVISEVVMKQRTQQSAATALSCSQAQVSRYVNQLRLQLQQILFEQE